MYFCMMLVGLLGFVYFTAVCRCLQPPLTDSAELSRRPVRLLGINTWDVAAALTHLDWTLFKSIHEVRTRAHTHARI